MTQAYCRMSRNFCARWREICKQMTCKAVRRALSGVALKAFMQNCEKSVVKSDDFEEND